MKGKLWQDWIILAASAWLFFSPFILGFATLSHPAAWVAFVCSIALYVCASEALVVPDALEEWVDGGVGLAMIVSPWALGYGAELLPTLNAVIVGLLVVGFAVSALVRDLQASAPPVHISRSPSTMR